MNKAKLAETGIIIIILVLIYQLAIALINAITGVYFLATSPFPRMGNSVMLNFLIPVVLYLSAIYLFVVYKKNLGEWLGGSDEQEVIVNISPVFAVYIAIFIICFIMLLNDLPDLISQSLFSNDTAENPRALGMSERYSEGFGRLMNISKMGLFIRLFLAVVFLAFSAAKLFSATRNRQVSGS